MPALRGPCMPALRGPMYAGLKGPMYASLKYNTRVNYDLVYKNERSFAQKTQKIIKDY